MEIETIPSKTNFITNKRRLILQLILFLVFLLGADIHPYRIVRVITVSYCRASWLAPLPLFVIGTDF